MHDWPALQDDVPSPALVAAWLVLDCLPSERVPMWAAYWMLDGHDGPAVVSLAGLSGRDTREVHDELPDALAECGVNLPVTEAAAAMVTFAAIAKLQAEGRASERWVVDKVCEIAAPNYNHSVLTLPLGQLFALDDEWGAGWGRTPEELRQVVRDAVQEQLVLASTPTAQERPEDIETVLLWRPTGPEELALVADSGWKAWPPRLPDQPIFYPVLNREYAVKIARDWNVPKSGVGYVTRFEVRKEFLDRYDVRQAGGSTILEYWIPAEDLPLLNASIVGLIEVTDEFH